MPVNKKIMTVDVEDYYQVAAFKDIITPSQWDEFPSRVAENTNKILDFFEENNVKATFFILGCVAEKEPELVKRIDALGHEVASHGYGHQKVFEQTPEEFKEDLVKAKRILESITGKAVLGYRAPSFSIDKRCEWAFDILKETGHVYSSSTYPVVHDHYGTPDWPIEAYETKSGLLEIPQSTIDFRGKRLPIGGGGYFRLFPQLLNKFLLSQFDKQRTQPYVFYFHPWEIDPEQPRIDKAPLKSKFRHYVNLSRMESKIKDLCKSHEWQTMKETFVSK
tara:strand:- start:2166 stop:2999 length:834 start_codon:yes stop_codon:yes gene_type:complete